MAYQGINTGTSPNSGTGDSLIVGGQKINSNFLEIYNVIGDGSDLFVGVVTQISAGTNVSISTAYGAVQVSAPTPSNISATNLNITGITTLGSSNGIGTVTIGTGSTALYVDGNTRITGILTVGTNSITIDGDNSNIKVGSGITIDGSTNTLLMGDSISINASLGIITTSTLVIGNNEFTGVGNTFNTLTVTGVSTLGIVTGATYFGDGSHLVDGRWILGSNGFSDYTFTGVGFTVTTNDPVLYLARGNVYEFNNNSGGSHPFEIRVSNGGAAYSNGVTNNGAATGVIKFEVPFNAPDTLYYQCTNHASMGNTISVYPSLI